MTTFSFTHSWSSFEKCRLRGTVTPPRLSFFVPCYASACMSCWEQWERVVLLSFDWDLKPKSKLGEFRAVPVLRANLTRVITPALFPPKSLDLFLAPAPAKDFWWRQSCRKCGVCSAVITSRERGRRKDVGIGQGGSEVSLRDQSRSLN